MTPYLPNCVVPLIFEGELEEAPYGMRGTGFLLRWNTKFFFVTAKHSLLPGSQHHLRVPLSFASDELIKLGQYGHVEVPENEEDTDWSDLAVFSVVPAEFGRDGVSNAIEPAYLPNRDTRELLISGMTLTVRGYPRVAPLSRIDYERKKIIIQAFTSDARLVGPTQSQGCYQLQFAESCPIDDFDFVSGSPVFAKTQFEGRLNWILVGVMLRGGGPQRLGRFVSTEVLKASFAYYSDPQSRANSVE